MKQNRLQRLLEIFLFCIVGFFILKIILAYSTDIWSDLEKLNFVTIVLSFLFYLGYLYLRALSWHRLIKVLGGNTSLKSDLEVWFLGESIRYIPGNIWSFVSKTYMGTSRGITKSTMITSLAVEVIMVIVTTAIISIPAIFFSSKYITNIGALIFTVLLVLGIILLGLVYVRKKIINLYHNLNQIPTKVFLSRQFYLAISLQFLAWLVFGLATYVLGLNLQLQSWIFVFIPVLVWLIGYISFITPMGLGVREAALIVILTPIIGVGKATLIAIISRILLIVAEISNVLVWATMNKKLDLKNLIKRMSQKWDVAILMLMILIYIITLSIFAILRHNAFASSYDLGNVDQTIWNTLHGHIFMMSSAGKNVSRIATHADFILILLAPLYLLWGNVRLLLISQSVFLALGAVPAFLLAKKILNNKLLALILTAIYLLNPNMQWINIYDVHGVALAIPLLLATFYFAYLGSHQLKNTSNKNWLLYWLFFFLSIITKEEISLFLATIGILLTLFYRSWKVGIISFLIGITWFLVMVFTVIPHFSVNHQHWAFSDWFIQQQDDLLQHNYADLLHITFNDLIQPENVIYYKALLRPFGGLPLIGLPWLLMGLPELLINVSSSNIAMRTVTLHYDSGIIPALVIGLIFAVKYIQVLLTWIKMRFKINVKIVNYSLIAVCGILLLVSIRMEYHYSPLPITPSCWCMVYQVDQQDRDFEKILQKIPTSAVVSASSEVRPHISHRFNAHNLPAIPANVNYIAMIDQDRSIGGYNPHGFEIALAKKLSADKYYQKLFHEGHFYLFKKL